jgi:hypothetical protein
MAWARLDENGPTWIAQTLQTLKPNNTKVFPCGTDPPTPAAATLKAGGMGVRNCEEVVQYDSKGRAHGSPSLLKNCLPNIVTHSTLGVQLLVRVNLPDTNATASGTLFPPLICNVPRVGAKYVLTEHQTQASLFKSKTSNHWVTTSSFDTSYQIQFIVVHFSLDLSQMMVMTRGVQRRLEDLCTLRNKYGAGIQRTGVNYARPTVYNVFSVPGILLVMYAVNSQCLASYWSRIPYVLNACHPIGHNIYSILFCWK